MQLETIIEQVCRYALGGIMRGIFEAVLSELGYTLGGHERAKLEAIMY
jgi:hypothetical protein